MTIDCEPVVTRRAVRVVGSRLPGDVIDFATITREIWTAPSPCVAGADGRVRVSSDLVVIQRELGLPALAPIPEPPSGYDPTTFRHLPWVKLRLSACDDPTIRPFWLDLGQSIVLPWKAATASLVVPADGAFFKPTPARPVIPPDNAEHVTYDAWIWVQLQRTSCCEPHCGLLTDAVRVPPSGDTGTRIVIPPRVRCVTIHADAGDALDVRWIADPLEVETSGVPLNAAQVVLTVPDVPILELTNGGAATRNVMLVWEVCA